MDEYCDALKLLDDPYVCNNLILLCQDCLYNGVGDKNLAKIAELHKKWKKYCTKNPTKVTDDSNRWEEFKTFYINELKILDENKSLLNPTKSANIAATAAHTRALENRLNTHIDDNNDRLEDLETFASAFQASIASGSVPPTIKTAGTESIFGESLTQNQSIQLMQRLQESEALQAKQRRSYEELLKKVAALEQRTTNTSASGASYNNVPSQSNEPDPDLHVDQNGNKWKQFKYYCWSFGCNVTHPSSKCERKKDNHKSTATFENMQSGSTKNLDKRGMWKMIKTAAGQRPNSLTVVNSRPL